jgi:hypothetical protein
MIIIPNKVVYELNGDDDDEGRMKRIGTLNVFAYGSGSLQLYRSKFSFSTLSQKGMDRRI